MSKGNSANLMKPGAKRRRSKEEIKQAKQKEKDDAKEMADALIELEKLRAADTVNKQRLAGLEAREARMLELSLIHI